MIALRASKLIDGTGEPPVSNAVVLVDGNRIIGAGPQSSVTVPPDASWIELGEATLLPGLIECHTHLSSCQELGYGPQFWGMPDVDLAFCIARNAEKLLRSGVTTARIAGEKDHLDFAYLRAWEAGFARGPRVVM